uniref:Uncharacterized protein n=1 Tax=viral metagenome TaxID=1070528 RepID=A0A2V0RML7_9ZZZZ
MSIASETKNYAIELAETAMNAFSKQARGNLPAPNGEEGVKVYTAKGGSAITLRSDTTSAAVVYDPEASLRNGQLCSTIYERDTTGKCTKVSKLDLGRATDEFLSVGLVSSGMKVFNSSGVDVIGGTQTAAVLSAVPRDISTLSSTDVANFCSNHERDMASGVVSRDESTLTMALSNHLGAKMCLARSNTLGNTVTRTWDDAIGARRSTVGQSLGPDGVGNLVLPVPEDGTLSAAFAADPAGTIAANPSLTLIDTDRLDADKNPLTLATYTADFFGSLAFSYHTGTTGLQFHMKAVAFDAADNAIEIIDFDTFAVAPVNQSYMTKIQGTLKSSTVPIARVCVFLDRQNIAGITETLILGYSLFKVSAFEECADIPARNMHVCVLEGLNASATLNINTAAVLSGVPDATNVFISSAYDASDAVTIDTNAVKIFMSAITKVLPRAYTVSGHGMMEKTISAMYDSDLVELSFKAMSFKDVAAAVKKAGSLAKMAGKGVADAAPVVEEVASMLATFPGMPGRIASGVAAGAKLLR